MKVRHIFFGKRFIKQLKDLPKPIRQKVEKAVDFFSKDPLHPSLRLHKLSGKYKEHWSISVDRSYRIIFVLLENGHAQLQSVGTHAIYDS